MRLTPRSISLTSDAITVILTADDGSEYRIKHSYGTADAFAEALENAAHMIRRWLARDE